MKTNNVLIIGAGRLGLSLGKILRQKNVAVFYWDKNIPRVSKKKSLKELTIGADFIFICVPSWAMREVLGVMKLSLGKKTIVVSTAKGLEKKTGKRMDEVFIEVLPREQLTAYISGPMLSLEIKKGLGASGIVATISKSVYKKIAILFSGTGLYFEYSPDVASVVLVGVLKNIYAFGLGLAKELKLGNNFYGWYVTKALVEMQLIINKLTKDDKIINTLAGVGDLITTGFSSNSRNMATAKEFITTGKCKTKWEGLVSLPLVVQLLSNQTDDLPILSTLYSVRGNGKKVKEVFGKLQKK